MEYFKQSKKITPENLADILKQGLELGDFIEFSAGLRVRVYDDNPAENIHAVLTSIAGYDGKLTLKNEFNKNNLFSFVLEGDKFWYKFSTDHKTKMICSRNTLDIALERGRTNIDLYLSNIF